MSALIALRCDLNHESTIKQIADFFSSGSRGGSRSSIASTLWNSVQISANGKGMSSADTPKASYRRSCLHSSYLRVFISVEDKYTVYQMLHSNHMIACSHRDKDETSEPLSSEIETRKSACCASVRLVHVTRRNYGATPILNSSGLASSLNYLLPPTSYLLISDTSKSHLSRAEVCSTRIKQLHHESL